MNIFILNNNLQKNVSMYCDQHIIKMRLETIQMISTCINYYNKNITRKVIDNTLKPLPYKSTHINHPCNIWIRKSKSNYNYMLHLLYFLILEHHYRFNNTNIYVKYMKVFDYLNNISSSLNNFYDIGLTKPYLAMDDKFKTSHIITSYINYYNSKPFSFNKHMTYHISRKNELYEIMFQKTLNKLNIEKKNDKLVLIVK